MQHHDFIQSEGHNGRPTVQHVPSVETSPLLGQVESHTLTERSLYYKELKHLFCNSCTVRFSFASRCLTEIELYTTQVTGGYLLQQSLQISSIFIVGRLVSYTLTSVRGRF